MSLNHSCLLGVMRKGMQKDQGEDEGRGADRAESRLLPLLSAHLWFTEIAQELFLCPATVKSEANSMYRKLGASSRSQALAGRGPRPPGR